MALLPTYFAHLNRTISHIVFKLVFNTLKFSILEFVALWSGCMAWGAISKARSLDGIGFASYSAKIPSCHLGPGIASHTTLVSIGHHFVWTYSEVPHMHGALITM